METHGAINIFWQGTMSSREECSLEEKNGRWSDVSTKFGIDNLRGIEVSYPKVTYIKHPHSSRNTCLYGQKRTCMGQNLKSW